jgi:hypothetical protein
LVPRTSVPGVDVEPAAARGRQLRDPRAGQAEGREERARAAAVVRREVALPLAGDVQQRHDLVGLEEPAAHARLLHPPPTIFSPSAISSMMSIRTSESLQESRDPATCAPGQLRRVELLEHVRTAGAMTSPIRRRTTAFGSTACAAVAWSAAWGRYG